MSGYTGGTAATDIARLRRMTAESEQDSTYANNDLVSILSRYPLPDVTNEWPLLHSGSANTDWTPTYDLANAAADIWEEKAACTVGYFDFTADGATFHKSQVYAQYRKEARLWRSRRVPGNHQMIVYPRQVPAESWIANLAEDDD